MTYFSKNFDTAWSSVDDWGNFVTLDELSGERDDGGLFLDKSESGVFDDTLNVREEDERFWIELNLRREDLVIFSVSFRKISEASSRYPVQISPRWMQRRQEGRPSSHYLFH